MLSPGASGASNRYLSTSVNLFCSAYGWLSARVAEITPDLVVSSCTSGGLEPSCPTSILEMFSLHTSYSTLCILAVDWSGAPPATPAGPTRVGPNPFRIGGGGGGGGGGILMP